MKLKSGEIGMTKKRITELLKTSYFRQAEVSEVMTEIVRLQEFVDRIASLVEQARGIKNGS